LSNWMTRYKPLGRGWKTSAYRPVFIGSDVSSVDLRQPCGEDLGVQCWPRLQATSSLGRTQASCDQAHGVV